MSDISSPSRLALAAPPAMLVVLADLARRCSVRHGLSGRRLPWALTVLAAALLTLAALTHWSEVALALAAKTLVLACVIAIRRLTAPLRARRPSPRERRRHGRHLLPGGGP